MAKADSRSQDPITPEDLLAYIASQDDFAFEREIYRQAHNLGFTVDHAGVYEDPILKKQRQFDIRASYTLGVRKICLTVECKGLSESYPLLVSCVPRSQRESFHERLYTDNVPTLGGSYTRIFRKLWQNALDPHALYPVGEPVGKAMRQVFRDRNGKLDGGDDVFDKWAQALASAAEVVSDAAAEVSSRDGGKARAAAILPVLVVSDKTLWIADYASDGELQRDPFPIDTITYYLGRKYEPSGAFVPFTISHLHIYTRSNVYALFHQIANGGGVWDQLFDY
jgi:hypothetical protein